MTQSHLYSRIIQRALRAPWAITLDYLAIVQDVLIARAKGLRLSDEDIAARIEASTGQRAAARADARQDGVIALIPVYGVICHRSFEASSGATSAEYVSAALRRAAADPSVKAIVLDISSPGGTVEGIPELAADLRAAAKEKPIVAFANALAASAAYWLATQATEIVVTDSGRVGSVGVYALTEDWSEYLAKEGIKINAISAGEYKLEGAPWEPLSEEGRAFIKAQVDATYVEFVSAVAKGRGVSVAEVKKNYGQGRVLSAREALRLGMVDRVGTLEEVIARANALARKPAMAAVHAPTPAAAVPAVPALTAAQPPHSEDSTEPDDKGNCPDGYEKDADGRCYLVSTRRASRQARADRDVLETTLALIGDVPTPN